MLALDPVARRCELARSVGVRTTLDSPAETQVEAVLAQTNGLGAAITVDVVGHSAVIENCVAATALFGQIVLLGTPRAPHEANLTDMLRPIHERGLIMRGAHRWRFPPSDVREVKQTISWIYRTLFDLMQSGQLQVAPLRSHLGLPEDAPRYYAGLQNDRDAYWGVVLDWTGD